MPRLTDDTVVCRVTAISRTRVDLDCGHGADFPEVLPAWMAARLAQLTVGEEQICPDCVAQEIAAGQSCAPAD
jgi:hypothetical protein